MNKRHIEISDNLIRLGFALKEEGEKTSDLSLEDVGDIILFLSSLVSDEINLSQFKVLSSMLGSKKMIDQITKDFTDEMFNSQEDFERGIREGYEDLLKQGLNGFDDDLDDDDSDDDDDFET